MVIVVYTAPADFFLQSAVMAGLKVVPIKSLPDGSLDLVDLKAKAEQHKDNLAAFMVMYLSSTNGITSHSQDR